MPDPDSRSRSWRPVDSDRRTSHVIAPFVEIEQIPTGRQTTAREDKAQQPTEIYAFSRGVDSTCAETEVVIAVTGEVFTRTFDAPAERPGRARARTQPPPAKSEPVIPLNAAPSASAPSAPLTPPISQGLLHSISSIPRSVLINVALVALLLGILLGVALALVLRY